MNKRHPLNRTARATALLSLIGGAALLSSCAMFRWRYQHWNEQVDRNADGVLAHAEAKTRGHGRTALLLIHGFGDGPHVWDKLAPRLADEGFTVRSMRLPGWCEPIEVKRQTTLEHWQEAVDTEIEALRRDHDHLVILSHSLGSGLATWMAQGETAHPDALVLYAPMFGISNARSPLLPTRTWFKIGNAVLPDRMILESLFEDHSEADNARPRTRRDPFVPVSLYKEIYRLIDERDAQEPRLACPLRLALPETDRVVDADKALRWFDALEAPEKTRITLPGTGHVLPLDLDALAETDRLVLWLKQQGITP